MFVTKWGLLGSGDGQFKYPNAIAVAPDGSVYVSEFGGQNNNHRIQKLTSAGVIISQWGSKGTGDGEFNQPFGVAVAPDGGVYVADQGNNRIQKFTVGP